MHYSTITRKKSKIKSRTFAIDQEKMIAVAIFLLLFCILTKPTTYSESVINGLKLFFSSVLPGLLPFMFLCKVLTNLNIQSHLGFIEKPMQKLFGLSKECVYPFMISIISGYPIGSKITADLYVSQKISDKDLLKCAVLSSTSGLIFIIGSVGASMLKSAKIGINIYVSSIISCIISVVLINIFEKLKQHKTKKALKPSTNNKEAENIISQPRFIYGEQKLENKNNFDINTKNNSLKQNKPNILNIITNSANDTCQSLLIVCFYISFFFVLIDILNQTKILSLFSKAISVLFSSNPEKTALSQGVMSGIVEMTRGVKMLSLMKNPLSLSLICSLISFGGFSIIFQSLAFLSKTNLKFSKFIFAKILQAVIAFPICYALLLVFKI